MDEPRMPALLVAHGRPASTCAAAEEGDVQAGDEIVQVGAGIEEVTVAEVNVWLYIAGHHDVDGLRRALPASRR